MAALTHESLVEYLLEESHEVAEVIESGAGIIDSELRDELGDVLLQVVLHAQLAHERGSFSFADVAGSINAKMIRRNPHVFLPDGSLRETFPATVDQIVQTWDEVKKSEKPQRTDPFDGIPQSLPALARAQKTLDRAERAGHQRPSASAQHGDLMSEAELGEQLFALVEAARVFGFDAERALRGAVATYQTNTLPPHTSPLVG